MRNRHLQTNQIFMRRGEYYLRLSKYDSWQLGGNSILLSLLSETDLKDAIIRAKSKYYDYVLEKDISDMCCYCKLHNTEKCYDTSCIGNDVIVTHFREKEMKVTSMGIAEFLTNDQVNQLITPQDDVVLV